MNDTYCPIKKIEPGKCPKCLRMNLCVKSLTFDYFILDDNANPKGHWGTEPKYFTYCPDRNCGFTSDKFMLTPQGFKFVPDYDRYLYEDGAPFSLTGDNIKEKTFTGNPFALPEGGKQ